MAQQVQVYPFDIPSVSHLHPGIPANLVQALRLDENITIGDAVDILNVKRAEGVSSSLAHLQVYDQAITDDIVETAQNRATVIRSTHGQIQFDQGGNAAIMALLIATNNAVNIMNNTINILNNTVNGLDWRLSRIEVVMENARIVRRNRHLRSLGPGQLYSWRRKEAIGSGTALAQQIHGIALPANVDINPPANVGATPANLNPVTATGNDILRLISFYNDTFGVTGADDLAIRRDKLICWLSESFF